MRSPVWFTLLCALTATVNAQQPPPAAFGQKVVLNIASQPVADALSELARQTGLGIAVYSSVGRGITAPKLEGEYTPAEALEQILTPTGLHAEYLDEKTVAVLEARSKDTISLTKVAPAAEGSGGLKSQDSDRPEAHERHSDPNSDTGTKSNKSESVTGVAHNHTRRRDLEEVVVTGTNIRGRESASPLFVYDREAIDQAGAGTVQDFIQRLPQNFNGGASEGTISSVTGGGTSGNLVDGTGVNLRGLGNDATLVLINGHRVAMGNSRANFVDISMIPLTAVERVEIVPDGASAIYGSDALGGVVNVILRKDFDGAESRARFGSVSDGANHTLELGQTVGQGWNSGSALVTYEYFDQTPLSATSRSYTSNAAKPFTLVPRQLRHSAILSAKQDLSTDVQLFSDGEYSHRSTYYDVAFPDFAQRTPANIDSYGATVGANTNLPNKRHLTVSAGFSNTDTKTEQLTFGASAPAVNYRSRSGIWSVDGKLDGALRWGLSRSVQFALGGQYRHEFFDFANLKLGSSFNPRRNVIAEFLELRIPLFAPRSDETLGDRLELTLADRNERYSDFGETNKPQVGLLWRLSEALRFRATFGRSFKAPLLSQTNPVPDQVVPFPLPDPTTGGDTNTLLVFGGNPNLNPETARTWTVGAEFLTPSAPEWTVSATYYNVNFKNRIVAPNLSIDLLDALRLESVLGPQIVQRNPLATLVQRLATTPGFVNFFGIDLTTIGAIFDTRVHNLSAVDTSGVDLSLLYEGTVRSGRIQAGLDGTYIIKFNNHFTEAAPAVAILNTPYNPTNLRLRGRVGVQWFSASVSSFVNFVNSYTDNRAGGLIHIPSWTTVDMTAEWKPRPLLGHGNEWSLMLGIVNVADRNPPYVVNSPYGINFDGANANALGRLYSLLITLRW